jgi:thiol-disulfide isomerase/thioredoxin
LSAGGTLTEADLKGKWTIIDFWGIWCPDCMVDAPYVAALHAAVQQDPSLRLISVHVDKRTGRWPDVQAYVTEKQVGYPVLLDPDRELYKKFQLAWVPTYLVVDPQGVVRGFRTDLSQERDPEGGVKAFLKAIAAMKAQPAAAGPG